jgi:uncharacterized membrane protein
MASRKIIVILLNILLRHYYHKINPDSISKDIDTILFRLRLARGLLLSIDFEVGSDILKTILVPSPNELSILAVVGIRIVLSWSLSKEIDRHNVDLLESNKQPVTG